jgi:hypothetical protein
MTARLSGSTRLTALSASKASPKSDDRQAQAVPCIIGDRSAVNAIFPYLRFASANGSSRLAAPPSSETSRTIRSGGERGGEILLRAVGRPAWRHPLAYPWDPGRPSRDLGQTRFRWVQAQLPSPPRRRSCCFSWAARAGPERHCRERRGPSASDGPLRPAGEGEGRPRRPAKPAPPLKRVGPRDAYEKPEPYLAPPHRPIPS